jgi:hypothetical protein
MFSNLTGPEFLLIIAGCVAVYYVVLALCYQRRFTNPLLSGKGRILQTVQAGPSGATHELVARPVEIEGEQLEILLEIPPEEESTLEMLDDDDSILVKEAEKVIELIQVEIDHIASNPPNPEELFTKLRNIVRQYRIFENTEYFEPINRYIALAVNRDCDIQWAEQDLLVLWN